MYPVFYVGFICKGCMWKKECEDSRKLKTKEVFAGSSRVAFPRSEACAQHMTRMRSWQMVTTSFRKCLADKAFPRDTREIFCFAELLYLIHTICSHTIYTHITHRCWGVLLRENPSHYTWELEIVIPIILYTIHCGFSSTPTSLYPYPWEVDSPNTFHTLLECQVRFWCCWKHWKKPSFGRCNRAYCGIRRAR